ncbi:MAG TPA: type 4a pilus biogenesis protein PilO [Terriglobales bacterium]|nr:type 4a pilus biogenesis protein PilO [Terriglobales bacterium]
MKWSELSAVKQLGVFLVVAIVVTGLAYYLVDKTIMDANDATRKQIVAVKAENDSLRPYENKVRDLDQQIENLKQQLEIQKRIVPDEKESDNFIRLVQSTAASAGIEVRSYVAKPTTAKEFYVESPFDLSLDGPYYSMLTFFDKLSKQERIVTVSNLQMGAIGKGGKYAYAPNETVTAACVATTYFSREAPAPGPAPAAKPAGR